MTNDLRPELAAALEELHPEARVETLPGDASTRRFHRLVLPAGGSRIVMDYGARFADETDDVRLARLFERAALPVARVLDILPEAGALILEDLGDTTLELALDRADERRAPSRGELYRAAVRLAADIATRGTEALRRSDRAAGPALDEERFLFEMRFFLEHYVGGFLGLSDAGTDLNDTVEDLARTAASHPRVLCHRDYHSRNLMVLPDRTLAMVDIQDARWGPDTYDIASLLRDAYVDLAEDEVADLLESYRIQLPGPPGPAEFRSRFHLVATQRMIKALGTFGYQISRLGRQRYRTAIPRTVRRLARLLPGHPETARLAEAMNGLELLTVRESS